MNIKDIYLDSLKELGYTEIEARFIYIVATHSGYFTVRHFLDFADTQLVLQALRNIAQNQAGAGWDTDGGNPFFRFPLRVAPQEPGFDSRPHGSRKRLLRRYHLG